MKSSVIIAVYNGERYIVEQMDSIREQSRLADEVIILDDNSTDKSFEIITQYIDRNELKWICKKNDDNLGYSKNFYQGVAESSNEIVFFCDQDDIWDYHKIETMMSIFEKNKNVKVLFHGYRPYYMNDNTRKVSNKILKDMRNTGRLRKIRLSKHFFTVLRPGCACAIDKKFAIHLNDLWKEGNYAHDFLIWSIGTLYEKAFILDRNLLTWRRYGGNSSDPTKKISEMGWKDMWHKDDISCQKSECRFLKELFDSFKDKPEINKQKKLISMDRKISEEALNYLQNQDILKMFFLVVMNHGYWYSLKRPIRQIIVMIMIKYEKYLPGFSNGGGKYIIYVCLE